MQTFKISFELTLPWGLHLQKAQEPVLGGVECDRGMVVLPGEWPSWSQEFGSSGFSGTFISVLPVVAPLHLAQKLPSLLGIYLIHREARPYQQACEFAICS